MKSNVKIVVGTALVVSALFTACTSQIASFDQNNDVLSRAAVSAYLQEGTYAITSSYTGKALDAAERSVISGSNVQVWDYSKGQTNQLWNIKNEGNGFYSIKNENSGLSLDVSAASKDAGANVQQYAWNGTDAQLWSIYKLSDGTYEIVSKCSGLALDVESASKENGANVQQYTRNGTVAQKWNLSLYKSALIPGATNGTSVGTYQKSFIGKSGSMNTLVWSDEFEGSELKRENWTFDTGNHGWGNSELQNYTTSKKNVSVEGGCLKITASNDLTSGRIKSSGLKEFKYGKIEARIKCDEGVGSWPAFWMLGTGSNYQWPYCGEIDIMEHNNTEKYIFQTCHWNGAGSSTSASYLHSDWGQTTQNNYWNKINTLDVTQWHTYSIEWTDSVIKFFVDGKQTMGCDIGNPSNGLDTFNKPFYIIFNYAMGGQFPGIYLASQFTNVPWNMYVDYVRCYQ